MSSAPRSTRLTSIVVSGRARALVGSGTQLILSNAGVVVILILNEGAAGGQILLQVVLSQVVLTLQLPFVVARRLAPLRPVCAVQSKRLGNALHV